MWFEFSDCFLCPFPFVVVRSYYCSHITEHTAGCFHLIWEVLSQQLIWWQTLICSWVILIASLCCHRSLACSTSMVSVSEAFIGVDTFHLRLSQNDLHRKYQHLRLGKEMADLAEFLLHKHSSLWSVHRIHEILLAQCYVLITPTPGNPMCMSPGFTCQPIQLLYKLGAVRNPVLRENGWCLQHVHTLVHKHTPWDYLKFPVCSTVFTESGSSLISSEYIIIPHLFPSPSTSSEHCFITHRRLLHTLFDSLKIRTSVHRHHFSFLRTRYLTDYSVHQPFSQHLYSGSYIPTIGLALGKDVWLLCTKSYHCIPYINAKLFIYCSPASPFTYIFFGELHFNVDLVMDSMPP